MSTIRSVQQTRRAGRAFRSKEPTIRLDSDRIESDWGSAAGDARINRLEQKPHQAAGTMRLGV